MPELLALSAPVGAVLKDRRQTIAVAESSTGGLVSAALLAVPGASAYFRGGGVVYTREAKIALGGISEAALESDRAATEAHALALAHAMREKMGTDWAIAETGATGPTGNRYGDPAGHTCIAVVGGGGEQVTTVRTGEEDRETNMWAFTRAAFDLLGRALDEADG
ncbi:MAG: CinA family protein [Alphaproteobacteria bacterium]|nr:CinA family protein [Alphaproteobacteria bacterium]